jgi:phage-related protein
VPIVDRRDVPLGLPQDLLDRQPQDPLFLRLRLRFYTGLCIIHWCGQANSLDWVLAGRSEDVSGGRATHGGIRASESPAGTSAHRLEEPTDWKPIASVGTGVKEIRVHAGQEHRVFYVARFEEGVYVLHAFEKRSRKTSAREIELARDRLREVLATKRRAR